MKRRTRNLVIGHLRPALLRMGEVVAREQPPEHWNELLDRIDEREREQSGADQQDTLLATRKDRRRASRLR